MVLWQSLATCRRGWRPSISNRVPRNPAIPLHYTCKSIAFWQSCAIFRKKGHCNNFTFGAVNTLAFWTPRSGPPQYAKYRDLLKLAIEQAAKKGFQLKSDRIDFEAKWQHLAPKATSPSIQPPAIQQPLVFSFLQGSKSTNEQHTRATQSLHYGDEEFYSCLSQYGLEWLRDSAHTYENINLSAHMMRLAVQNGVGFRTENQEVRTKHAQLFQEYTANEYLKAIKQLFAVFQIATLSNLHQFPFGFLWAPKIMQPPFVYVGAQRPCLIFLILSQEPDQPFKFGTVVFDYRQDREFLAHSRTLNICADVVQLSSHSLATFPITVRVNEGLQYIHLSEFATLQCPTCALCYLHSLGAAPCFLHQVTPANAVIVKTRERRGSSFSQLGLEPNHTGLTAQSLFFLEESCRVKRSDTQTFSNFSNYFKRVLKLQKRSSSFSK